MLLKSSTTTQGQYAAGLTRGYHEFIMTTAHMGLMTTAYVGLMTTANVGLSRVEWGGYKHASPPPPLVP